MPSISNISFSVQFDLTGVPTLRITDTSTHGLIATRVASFDITQPDLYTREGNILAPDMAAGATTFSIALRLDSNGLPQVGTYRIVMTVRNAGYDDTEATREWISTYVPVNLVITENFDVFTPNLSVRDNTTYAVSNFNSGPLTRSWSITSVPTGTITGSGVTQSLLYNGNYYDANYTLSLTSSLLYTHQVYTWFTVNETVSKTVNTYAQTPSTLVQLVTDISALKLSVDNAINSGNEFYRQQADFEYAQTLFVHIIDKIKVNNTANIYKDLKDLIAVLNNYQIPVYTPTNQPITAYDLSAYFPGAVWGNVTGTLSAQTDLWNVLQDLYVRDHYTHTQSVASTTWTITHNMGKKPSVSVVDTSDDEVVGEVHHNSTNQLVITFSAAVSGKAYLN
jgi:hypothetical protein